MELSLLTFSVLALVVVMTPGPTVLLALSNGTRFGIVVAGISAQRLRCPLWALCSAALTLLANVDKGPNDALLPTFSRQKNR